MKNFYYNNYVKNLSDHFIKELSSIHYTHGFEAGNEFEVSLCKILKRILPDKYGVVRGFLVDKLGNVAGDDIIIYDRIRFPTIQIREKDDYSRKEYIPIEAAYCYIEAKHTINIQGDDGQSFYKACTQVNNVKKLCATRQVIGLNQIAPNIILTGAKVTQDDFPDYANPMYAIIWARNVRIKQSDRNFITGQDLYDKLEGLSMNYEEVADLCVLGKDNLIISAFLKGIQMRKTVRSPFYIPGKSIHCCRVAEDVAFGIGILSLLAALDRIQLGALPWHEVIINGLQIPYE